MDSAGGDEGWHRPTKKGLPVAGCHTVGLVLKDTETAITIVHSRDKTNGHVMGTLTIPKVAITSLRVLA